ncbi:uncharacterized protein [Nicotiana tomentosiformis]|uniref:uncharacterized protein n=1 Tax=Nicotiana tomentosiformis TaxID=4098 RepID=UPI00388C90A2
MIIKLVIEECTINIVSAYPPHVGLDEEVKRHFWEGLDEIVRQVSSAEKLFIGRDFNGHIGSTDGDYGKVHGGFGFGKRNGGGTSLLDFAKAFGLVIANSSFPKREGHLVTFQNTVAKTQIDYLLLKRCDRELYKDCKVIPGEILATQHRLLVMDVGIILNRRKRSTRGRPRISWGALTKDKAQELEGWLSSMGAWRSSGDASTIWSATSDCIREATREVLGVSTGISGGHKRDWWWNEVVQDLTTSQAGGGEQTSTTHAPWHAAVNYQTQVYYLQVEFSWLQWLEQTQDQHATVDEKKRLDRWTRFHPPAFSGGQLEDL